jgi:hypothetical protein
MFEEFGFYILVLLWNILFLWAIVSALANYSFFLMLLVLAFFTFVYFKINENPNEEQFFNYCFYIPISLVRLIKGAIIFLSKKHLKGAVSNDYK